MRDNDLAAFIIITMCTMFVLTTGEPDIIDGWTASSNKAEVAK